jgi:hypothetical protein
MNSMRGTRWASRLLRNLVMVMRDLAAWWSLPGTGTSCLMVRYACIARVRALVANSIDESTFNQIASK